MARGVDEQVLATALEDTPELLDGVAEAFWASKIRQALGSIDPAEILSWYGGPSHG
jgi:hypothetical protein